MLFYLQLPQPNTQSQDKIHLNEKNNLDSMQTSISSCLDTEKDNDSIESSTSDDNERFQKLNTTSMTLDQFDSTRIDSFVDNCSGNNKSNKNSYYSMWKSETNKNCTNIIENIQSNPKKINFSNIEHTTKHNNCIPVRCFLILKFKCI